MRFDLEWLWLGIPCAPIFAGAVKVKANSVEGLGWESVESNLEIVMVGMGASSLSLIHI